MAPSEAMRRVVAAGRTGRKGGKGFYRYDAEGKKGGVDTSIYEIIRGRAEPVPPDAQRQVPPDEIVDRCVLAMVNEAALCLQEGVLRSARDGDIGAVFGIGFPPFRGGPFRYIDSVGVATIVERLEELNVRFNPHFAPAEMLLQMVLQGGRRTFYGRTGV